MTDPLFENRRHAGRLLAEHLRGMPLTNPLVLGIPRGGIEVGAPIADALGAELDVVLSRKLRDAEQPELARGAVGEGGEVYLNGPVRSGADADHIEAERRFQLAEIDRRKGHFRAVRPQAPVRNRSVLITDDGIATGSTMIAAIHAVRAGGAAQVIVAVPVASGDRLARIARLCDRALCLHTPETFWAIGQFYRDFEQVSDDRVIELLQRFGQPSTQGIPHHADAAYPTPRDR